MALFDEETRRRIPENAWQHAEAEGELEQAKEVLKGVPPEYRAYVALQTECMIGRGLVLLGLLSEAGVLPNREAAHGA